MMINFCQFLLKQWKEPFSFVQDKWCPLTTTKSGCLLQLRHGQGLTVSSADKYS